jgi:PucR family transcriptional regulator, purine catabolism regulatory protein
MLTVGGLTEELDLELAAGAERADGPIRWVHISELDDPTPWLAGGELLLTTGIQLTTAARQRAFLALLDDRGLAGLGLGTGFGHKRLPKALTDEARKRRFPLFEIPYEMPFIALTEKAFTQLINEQYGVLERGVAVHERLERLVIEERGLDEVLEAVCSAVACSALLLDGHGGVLARRDQPGVEISEQALGGIGSEIRGRSAAGRVGPFAPDGGELAGRLLVAPVPARGGGAASAWLAVVRPEGELSEFDRLIARQAAIVLALELMRQRVVRDTERRLAGDVLAEALSGRLDSEELRGRLRPFGIGEEAAVLIFQVDDPPAGEERLEAAFRERGVGALVAATSAGRRPLLCAVVDATSQDQDPVELARAARSALAAAGAEARAAASRATPVGALRRAFHEARCALEATSVSNGEAPDVASHDDLGAFTLLLALQDDDALRLYADNLLAPIEGTDGEYGGELLRSLEAYIEQNGQWERAARQLYCHRHTLRYRIRRIEDLTGRDLSRAHDRIELWLALRARELVS